MPSWARTATTRKIVARHTRKAKCAGVGVGRIELLRCRFRDWRIGRSRRQFAIGPDGAVFEIFLFPDGDGAFQGVDGVATGFESGGAVRGAYGDEDASFADFQAAQAVGDGPRSIWNFSWMAVAISRILVRAMDS